MHSADEALCTSRARLDESHDRILETARSVCALREIVQDTLARVQHCKKLVNHGNGHRKSAPSDSAAAVGIQSAWIGE